MPDDLAFNGVRSAVRRNACYPATTWAAAIQPSRDVVDNSVAFADRVVVVVIDDLHFEKQTEAVKDLVRHIVGELGAKAAIALVTTSGTLGVELSDSRNASEREVGFVVK